jgi:hypothetical protein
MIKYGVEQAEVAAAASGSAHTPNEKIVIREVPFTGIFSSVLTNLAYNVTVHVPGVSGFEQKAWRGSNRTFMLVGYESVLDHAEALIASLVAQALTARDREWKAYQRANANAVRGWTAMQKFVWRRSFLHGFTGGVASRLAAQHKTATKEPGTALAVRDRDAQVKDWMNDKFNLRSTNASLSTNLDAKFLGNVAGRNADVGAKSVSKQDREIEK